MLLPIHEYWKRNGIPDAYDIIEVVEDEDEKYPMIVRHREDGSRDFIATPKGIKLIKVPLHALPPKLQHTYNDDALRDAEDNQNIWCYADKETAQVVSDEMRTIKQIHLRMRKLVHA